jgi:hypothetical protein
VRIRKFRRIRLSPASILIVIAVLAIGAGGATAASGVGRKQVKQIVKNFFNSHKKELQGANGANGANGAPGTARAYAVVQNDATFVPERTKGFSAVERVETGEYCLTAPGIDANTVPPVVSADYGLSVGGDLGAYARQSSLDCDSSSQFEVVTQLGASFSNGVGFTVIVP